MTFRLTPRALNDLDQIDSWVLSKFGEAVAARVSREFLELFAILAIQPGLYPAAKGIDGFQF
jgi:plasmid stabilization system protein ParE